MISLNFQTDYLIVTPHINPVDGYDCFMVKGYIKGEPIFMMELEEQPRLDFDTKCIPIPCMSPKTQILDVRQGYIMSVLFSEGILKANGHKMDPAPAPVE